MSRFLVGVAHVVVLLTWTVFGLLLWIPFLVRAMGIYTFVLSASLLRAGPKTLKYERFLHFATLFYSIGFKRILRSWGTHHEFDEGIEESVEPLEQELDLWRVLKEIVWSIIFWILCLLFWLTLVNDLSSILNRIERAYDYARGKEKVTTVEKCPAENQDRLSQQVESLKGELQACIGDSRSAEEITRRLLGECTSSLENCQTKNGSTGAHEANGGPLLIKKGTCTVSGSLVCSISVRNSSPETLLMTLRGGPSVGATDANGTFRSIDSVRRGSSSPGLLPLSFSLTADTVTLFYFYYGYASGIESGSPIQSMTLSYSPTEQGEFEEITLRDIPFKND